MKIYSVNDKEFKEYGCVLKGYNYFELFEILANTEIPENGIVYKSLETALEKPAVAKEMMTRGFGGYPVQIGYVNGINRKMNCLEYHKSSEFNIAMDDIILVLGKKQEIINGIFDSSLCKAFLIPAGTGVELYATTLHYAPFSCSDKGYRVICVLPKGTNAEKQDMTVKSAEDKICFGVNKWLLAHADAPEANDGASVCIVGNNIEYKDLEGYYE